MHVQWYGVGWGGGVVGGGGGWGVGRCMYTGEGVLTCLSLLPPAPQLLLPALQPRHRATACGPAGRSAAAPAA